MADKQINPAQPSGDFAAMERDWENVDAILGGITSLKKHAATFLPQFPEEMDDVWEFRVQLAKFTNIFRDVVENLSARPFADEVTLKEPSPLFEEFADDVDAQGNSLHVFAEQSFFNAVAYGVDWLIVDYTSNGPENGSVADEKRAGVRPFWRRYSATNAIAVYSDMVDGEEQFVHARFREWHTARDQFEESSAERVRVWDRQQQDDGTYAPPTVEVWEKQKREKRDDYEWVLIQQPRPITIPVIPVVPVLTARRIGSSWRMRLPMKDAADLQLTHFRNESGIEYSKTMSNFPILTGNGITPPMKDGKIQRLTIGPQTVLYAPPTASGSIPNWSIIEPSAASLSFNAEDVKNTAKELRELGRQPLTSAMGNLTVIASAVAGQKGAAAIQSWAIGLKNALEKALWLTALWYKTDEQAEVTINTDFDLSWTEDDGFDHILTMREKGEISREALIHEAKRRSLIDKDYDSEEDLEKLLEEDESLGDEEEDALMPQPVVLEQQPVEEDREAEEEETA